MFCMQLVVLASPSTAAVLTPAWQYASAYLVATSMSKHISHHVGAFRHAHAAAVLTHAGAAVLTPSHALVMQ